MSLEVLLVPLGIAAVAAIREANNASQYESYKPTRITDQNLLQDALKSMGTTVHSAADGRVVANSPYGRVTFQRLGQVFFGRVDADESQTANLLDALDMSVGALLQKRTVDALHARAEEMGMVLVSQTASNGDVQLVFEEAR